MPLGKRLKIFERSEAEQTRIFGDLMEHEKRITRECGSANSEYGHSAKVFVKLSEICHPASPR